MSRVVDDKPDLTQQVDVNVFRAQMPDRFTQADDDAVLFGVFPAVIHVVGANAVAEAEMNVNGNAEVYVLNHGLIIWYNSVGIEIGFNQITVVGIDDDDNVVVQVDNCTVVKMDNDTTVSFIIKPEDTTALYRLIAASFELFSADNDGSEDDFGGDDANGDNQWFTLGVADDLDSGEMAGPGDAAMSVEVAAAGGTKRQRGDVGVDVKRKR